MDISMHISKNKSEEIHQLGYFAKIESLMYIMNYTRSNIASLVGKLNRFTNNPSINHWKVINNVLKYLSYILDYGSHYIGYSMALEGYNDANWLYDTKNSKFTNGYVFDGLIRSWKSFQRTCITRFIMKS